MPAVNNAPYAFAFAAAQLLAIPGLAIALYLYVLGRVIRSGHLVQAGFELLFSGVVVLPFVLLCFVALLVAGVFSSVRPWASLVLVVLNLGVVATAWIISPPSQASDLLVWLPALTSLAIASRLVVHGFYA